MVPPKTLWQQLYESLEAGDDQTFVDTCASNPEEIIRRFPEWQRAPEEIRRDEAAVQQYFHTLVMTARVFDEVFGNSELIEMLSPPDNPLNRWQRDFAAADQLLANRNAPLAAVHFQNLLDELRGVSGNAVDQMIGFVLGRLSDCHYKLGDLASALRHTTAALEHCQSHSDAEGMIAYAGNLVMLHASMGNDEERALAVDRLIALRETFTDDDRSEQLHATFGNAAVEVNNRAENLRTKGEFARARPMYEEAIRLGRLAGPADERLAKVLGNLAFLLIQVHGDDLPRAEELLLEARAIQERVLPPNHPNLAMTLNNLGGFYQTIGKADEANEHYHASLDMKSVNLAPDDPAFRTTLQNVVTLAGSTYDDPSGKIALERLAKIDAGTAGDDECQWLGQLCDVYLRLGNVDAAETAVLTLTTLANERKHDLWRAAALGKLGEVRAAQNRPAEALPLFQQSISVLRDVADGDPQHLSAALNNLGQFFNERGRNAEAVPLLVEGLSIKEKETGTENIEWSTNANNLALSYLKLKRIDEAIPLLEKTLDVRRRLLPEGHPYIAQSYFNLAMAHLDANRIDAALPLLAESLRHEHIAIEDAFAVSSEEERLAYLTTARSSFNTILLMLMPRAEEHPGIAAVLFDATVQRKGLVADRMTAERDVLWSQADSKLAPAMTELRQVRERIARIALAATAGSDAELRDLTSRRRELERTLAENVPGVDLANRLQTANRTTIAHALPHDSALIEFVAFDLGAAGTDVTYSAYLAFVLPGGDPDNLTAIVLGLGDSVESWVEKFRELLLAEFETPEEADAIVGARNELGDQIRGHLLDRVRPMLGSRTKLFLAPDGILNRFPFHALADADGQPLCETYEISYLETGRDLLRTPRHSSGTPSPPVVIAAPDYNHGSTTPDVETPFTLLSATEREGREVAAILDVDPWIGASALKSRVTASRSPLILHLATHGFFVDTDSRDIDAALLSSGLALAGANTAANGGTLPADAENGLLYAYDVLSMDLSRTALVVLSACDTGLGEYQKGEGVYGLRRAFMVAGARSQIVTLWSVPDDTTAEFMVRFYTELLGGASRVNALRAAQREIRDRYGDAYSWAAFMLIGDAGPLSASYT